MRNETRCQTKIVIFACALALVTGIAVAATVEKDKDALGILQRLLAAVETGDYDRFVADGNAVFTRNVFRT